MDRNATYHLFLDEAGDTTFYGKGKIPIVGQEGVSKCFIMGMLRFNMPLSEITERVVSLQNSIANDRYFRGIPSIEKKRNKFGYFLHAKDDVPEVRKLAFDLIQSSDCTFEAVVARKVYSLYERKHNGREVEMYADLLSHLLEGNLDGRSRLVLNIAKRTKCTTHANLQLGLRKGIDRFKLNNIETTVNPEVVFNVQQPTGEPLLNLADYCCWAVQRVFEKGETRFYDYIKDKVTSVVDLYNPSEEEKKCYSAANPLTKANWIK